MQFVLFSTLRAKNTLLFKIIKSTLALCDIMKTDRLQHFGGHVFVDDAHVGLQDSDQCRYHHFLIVYY